MTPRSAQGGRLTPKNLKLAFGRGETAANGNAKRNRDDRSESGSVRSRGSVVSAKSYNSESSRSSNKSTSIKQAQPVLGKGRALNF